MSEANNRKQRVPLIPDKEREEISARIREALAHIGADSAAEFARMVGNISRGTTHNWVRGKSVPYCTHIFLIEDATGVSARWIALGEGPKLVSQRDRGGEQPPFTESDLLSMPDDVLADLLSDISAALRKRR